MWPSASAASRRPVLTENRHTLDDGSVSSDVRLELVLERFVSASGKEVAAPLPRRHRAGADLE